MRDAYPQGPDAVIGVVIVFVGELAAHLESLSSRVAALEAEKAALRSESAAVRARLRTDSHNSSKPPSSEGPGVRPHPKSQRLPPGRKSGGQPGHIGHTLAMVDDPDEVVVHPPSHCHACGRSLDDVPTRRRERRQVIAIPPVNVRGVEHQGATKCCPGCGAETSGVFPNGVAAPAPYGPGITTAAVSLNQGQWLPLERTSEVLADLFGCPISEGTVERAVAACHAQLAGVEAAIKHAIVAAPVGHFDETGRALRAKLAWLHVASTRDLTCYATHAKRGRDALDAIGSLPPFRGRALHDGWASSWQYGACTHGRCNGHHVRELTVIAEELGQPWAQRLKELLGEIKTAVDTARGHGESGLAMGVQEAFAARYDALLADGGTANPPPEPTRRRGRPKLGTAGSLVERLREHKGATLAFTEDFAVPFDNNQAERDLRMVNVREKLSGCFRTPTGAERFCRIRGYISTLRKQGMPILSALGQAIVGHPPMPALIAPSAPG